MKMEFRDSKNDDWDAAEKPTSPGNERKAPRPKRPVLINIDDIVLANSGRKIDDRKVKQLERSITDQGLRHPIHIYKLRNLHKGKFGLAAGQHRLRALKNLGFQSVSAVIITRKEAKAWRPSENLHRNDLSPLETSQAIVDYARARRHLPNVDDEISKGGKQPKDRGYKKLAKAIGYDRKRIAEAHAHAALSDSVKKMVLMRPRFNKRTELNLLTKMKTDKEQLRYIRGQSDCGPRKTVSVEKSGRSDRTKRSKLGWESCIALGRLKRAWKVSTFRPLYEKQPSGARKEFVRQMLH
jgi:ParB family transcriptional regulator, chromosome partitioning protein